MVETATTLKPLTDTERKKMDEFLARAAAEADVHAPAVRIGRAYVALTWLSLPRREQIDPKDRQTDRVAPGETVYLTDAEAQKFLRHSQGDGRRVAVIRLKSEVGTDGPPKPPPSLLTGAIFRPVTPMPDGTRPDPKGSTKIVEQSEVPVDAEQAAGGRAADLDALDIPPGGSVPVDPGAMYAGADMDLMAAVKNQAGLNTKKG